MHACGLHKVLQWVEIFSENSLSYLLVKLFKNTTLEKISSQMLLDSLEPTMYNFWASLLHIHLWLSVLSYCGALWILAIKECKETTLENMWEFCFIFSYITYLYIHICTGLGLLGYNKLSAFHTIFEEFWGRLRFSTGKNWDLKGTDSSYIKILHSEVRSEKPTAYEIFKNSQGILVGKLDGFS